jgi:hypothetical protein
VTTAALWPLDHRFPRVLHGPGGFDEGLLFTPDSQALLATGGDGAVRLWPLTPDGDPESRIVLQSDSRVKTLALHAESGRVAATARLGVRVGSLFGGPVRNLAGFAPRPSSDGSPFLQTDVW